MTERLNLNDNLFINIMWFWGQICIIFKALFDLEIRRRLLYRLNIC